eukprot:7391847-Prymnesium_polylepis.2
MDRIARCQLPAQAGAKAREFKWRNVTCPRNHHFETDFHLEHVIPPVDAKVQAPLSTHIGHVHDRQNENGTEPLPGAVSAQAQTHAMYCSRPGGTVTLYTPGMAEMH